MEKLVEYKGDFRVCFFRLSSVPFTGLWWFRMLSSLGM
jgi:hypothetical protein